MSMPTTTHVPLKDNASLWIKVLPVRKVLKPSADIFSAREREAKHASTQAQKAQNRVEKNSERKAALPVPALCSLRLRW
jgi:hypothetical protein